MNELFRYTNMHKMYYDPYYEISGPDYNFVRQDMYKKYSNTLIYSIGFTSNKLRNIINRHVHLDINDFGSWRGYALYGLHKHIEELILKEIYLTRRRLASNKIGTWYQYHKWFI